MTKKEIESKLYVLFELLERIDATGSMQSAVSKSNAICRLSETGFWITCLLNALKEEQNIEKTQ